MFNNKRGDISWFVLGTILAIVTLVVFLIAIYGFPWSKTFDRTACHESIVVKASLPGDTATVKDMMSVRCKARYICVTAKGSGAGNCNNLGKTFETKRLAGTNKATREEQIKMFMAQEMADCWNMFGEGKLQIFSRGWTFGEKRDLSGNTINAQARGIICDKIEFDNTVTGVYSDGSKVVLKDPTKNDFIPDISGFAYYLATHKSPGKDISYMDYLRNTPQGDSANQMYGGLVDATTVTTDPSKVTVEDMKNADRMGLTNVKSIFYVETTLTNAGKIIGGAVGAVLGIVTEIYTGGASSKVIRHGGLLFGASPSGVVGKVLGLGGITGIFAYSGSAVGDFMQKTLWGLPNDQVFVGGLFLTDYTAEGFKRYQIDEFVNYA
jgi:hypothetical protein